MRLAYLASKHGVPRKLVLNMDETPLMIVPRHGSTWGKKGGRSQAPGATDKRQLTATPWLNAEGELQSIVVIVVRRREDDQRLVRCRQLLTVQVSIARVEYVPAVDGGVPHGQLLACKLVDLRVDIAAVD